MMFFLLFNPKINFGSYFSHNLSINLKFLNMSKI